MKTIKDENGNQLIGYIEIDGLALPRGYLIEALPDFERFMRCLDDATNLNRQMTDNGGRVPAYVETWSAAYMEEVEATMREVGALQQQAAGQLRDEFAAR